MRHKDIEYVKIHSHVSLFTGVATFWEFSNDLVRFVGVDYMDYSTVIVHQVGFTYKLLKIT